MSTRLLVIKDGVIKPASSVDVLRVSSADTLTTPRTINGVPFNGSQNITINAVDSTPRIASSEKGVANGVVPLNSSALIDAQFLPSYVDDVLEYSTLSVFPSVGETGKLYVAIDTNLVYRWTGSVYAVTSTSLALGTTSTTAFRGDYGNTAYTHSQITNGNPHGVTLNSLVGTQTANRVLRSDGTNVTLSQINLANDTVGVLPINLGGTGSNTQNFVDLTVAQTIGGNKTLSGITTVSNTTASTSISTGAFIVPNGGVGIGGTLTANSVVVTGGFKATGNVTLSALSTSQQGAIFSNSTYMYFALTNNNAPSGSRVFDIEFNPSGVINFRKINDIYSAITQTLLSFSTTGAASFSNNVVMSALPTSSTGLAAGTLWRNGNVINII